MSLIMSKVGKRRTTTTCIICNTSLNHGEREEDKFPANQNKFLVQNFCGHFGIPLPFRDTDNKLIDWNFNCDSDESLPFCLSCKDTAESLIPLDEQLKSLKSAVDRVESNVKSQILESHNRTSIGGNDETSNGIKDTRIKFIRDLILGPLLRLSTKKSTTKAAATTTIASSYKVKPPVKHRHQTKARKSSPIKALNLEFAHDHHDDDRELNSSINDDDWFGDEASSVPIGLPALDDEKQQNGQKVQQHRNLRTKRKVQQKKINRSGTLSKSVKNKKLKLPNPSHNHDGDQNSTEPDDTMDAVEPEMCKDDDDDVDFEPEAFKDNDDAADDGDFEPPRRARGPRKNYKIARKWEKKKDKEKKKEKKTKEESLKRKNVHVIQVPGEINKYSYAGYEFCKNDNDRFYCTLCPDHHLYAKKYGVIQHIRCMHLQDKWMTDWLCDTCGREFKRSNDLKKHTETHLENRSVICHACGGSYKSQILLQRHYKVIHLGGKDQYPCKYDGCDQIFTSERKYHRHLRKLHRDLPREQLPEKIQFCPYCPCSYVRKRVMATHIRNFHSEEAKAAAAALAVQESETNNNYHTTQYPSSLSSPPSSATLEVLQSPQLMPILPHKGPKIPKTNRRRGIRTTKPQLEFYQCNLCAYKYKSWQCLRQHQLKIHNVPKMRRMGSSNSKTTNSNNGLQGNDHNGFECNEQG